MSNKLPSYYNTAILSRSVKPECEQNHEEDYEREQRRMEFLAEQGFQDQQLNEKDEE